jgi:transmembrane sensor
MLCRENNPTRSKAGLDLIRAAPQKPQHTDMLVRILRIIQACAALVLLLRGMSGAPPDSNPVIYTTALGEHAYISLDDKSRIELNTGSSVLVNYSATVRSIILLRGELLVEVRHGDVRPFRVYSGPSVIEDIGTQFDVFRSGGATRVTVTDGVIRIYSATGDVSGGNRSMEVRTAQTELHKGQQVEMSEQSGMIVNHATLSTDELSRLLAWREGLVEFYETPLKDALEEFNRYHPEQLRIADSSLGQRQVSGTFLIGIEDSFIQALEREFELRLKNSTQMDGTPIITLYAAPAKKRPTRE